MKTEKKISESREENRMPHMKRNVEGVLGVSGVSGVKGDVGKSIGDKERASRRLSDSTTTTLAIHFLLLLSISIL